MTKEGVGWMWDGGGDITGNGKRMEGRTGVYKWRGPLYISHSTSCGCWSALLLKKVRGNETLGPLGGVWGLFWGAFVYNWDYSRVLWVCLGWLFFWHSLFDVPSELASA